MNSEIPLVSVCIPSYNASKYIGDSIDSLLRQAYPNIEIIVIDDGSTDDTQIVLSKIKDPRLKWFIQENSGAAAARNKAFKASTGEYIKFMDADDLINAKCIEAQVAKLKIKSNAIASSKWGRFCKEDMSDLKVIDEVVWQDYKGLDWIIDSLTVSGTNMMQPGIFLIPRRVILKAGLWNEDLSLIDDFEFMVRIMLNSSAVLFCEDALLYYRGGLQNSLSGQRSESHMNSAYKAISICTDLILNLRNDAKTHIALANLWQRWEYQFYPSYKALSKKAAEMVKTLGGSNITAGGGKLFVLTSKMIGWKSAYFIRNILSR